MYCYIVKLLADMSYYLIANTVHVVNLNTCYKLCKVNEKGFWAKRDSTLTETHIRL